jgi:hypothetical protein
MIPPQNWNFIFVWVIYCSGCCLILPLTADAKNPSWQMFSYGNIEGISEYDRVKTRVLLEELHDFHLSMEGAMSQFLPNPQLRVVAMQEDFIFTHFPDEVTHTEAGFFMTLPNYDLLVIRRPWFKEPSTKEAIFKEYAKRILSLKNSGMPYWALEGLSRSFAKLHHGNKYPAQIPDQIKETLPQFMDWEDFFSMTHPSTLEALDASALQMFSDQAFYLCEYFMKARRKKLRNPFIQFVLNKEAYHVTSEILEEKFEVSFENLNQTIKEAANKQTFRKYKISDRAKVELYPKQMEMEKCTPYFLGVVLSGVTALAEKFDGKEKSVEGIELLEPYLFLENASPGAFEEAAQICLLWEDYEASMKFAELAFERESRRPGVLLPLALELWASQKAYPREKLEPELVGRLISLSTSILDYDPRNEVALKMQLYAYAFSSKSVDSEAVVYQLLVGKILLKKDPQAQLAYAVILGKSGQIEAGRELVEKVMQKPDLPKEAHAYSKWLLQKVF